MRPLLLANFLSLLALGACRQDMHDQPRFKPLRMSDFYADLRSARPLPAGTVARGQLRENTYFYTAMINGTPGDALPFSLTRNLLERGHERFNIFCAPCHSRLGDGNGMIVQRGYRHPPSFHIDRLRTAPLGHFFDVITNGFGAMPDYAAQITPQDRWAITAYIRALQLSQSAPADMVPAAERGHMVSQPPEIPPTPGTGATTPNTTESEHTGNQAK